MSKLGITNKGFRWLSVSDLVERGWLEKPIDGNHGEIHPKASDFVAEGIPFIMASDIKNGVIDFKTCAFLSKHQADNLRKGFSLHGDVLLTHKATIGETAIVPRVSAPYIMLTPQVTYYRACDKDSISNRYLLQYFRSQLFQDTISLWASSGATRSYIGITEQGKLPVVLPPIEIQRKIAAVVSAYDDLIENNNRRIALLEKMGEELYREWFVRLRFPGHESTKIVKGIPEGWRAGQISEICSDVRSHVKLRNLDADSRYIGLEHITPNSMILKDHGCGGDVQSDKISFRPYDILFGKIRPYLEKVSIAHFSGICSTDAIVLRPKSENLLGFAFLTVSSASFLDLANTASKGTKMPRADWDFLAQQKIALPPPDLQARFDSQFRPILSAAIRYQSQTDNCCLARNRLLTRLMSGKIDLETLDIAFPPSMQEAA